MLMMDYLCGISALFELPARASSLDEQSARALYDISCSCLWHDASVCRKFESLSSSQALIGECHEEHQASRMQALVLLDNLPQDSK
jgi:hypothetical protein